MQERSAEPGSPDDGGSGAESDGYGEAGLSWEAVMQSIQVAAHTCFWVQGTWRGRPCSMQCPFAHRFQCHACDEVLAARKQ